MAGSEKYRIETLVSGLQVVVGRDGVNVRPFGWTVFDPAEHDVPAIMKEWAAHGRFQ